MTGIHFTCELEQTGIYWCICPSMSAGMKKTLSAIREAISDHGNKNERFSNWKTDLGRFPQLLISRNSIRGRRKFIATRIWKGPNSKSDLRVWVCVREWVSFENDRLVGDKQSKKILVKQIYSSINCYWDVKINWWLVHRRVGRCALMKIKFSALEINHIFMQGCWCTP